ncbi:hypothetical protein BJX96DRAFT_60415 [Aspergillus floccosus]
MGHKVSSVAGVRSDRYYESGNAINEIWVGDVEVISRLPFGDSEMGQAAWPKGGWPKIPWRNFVIPMRRGIKFTNKPKKIQSEHWTMIGLIMGVHIALMVFSVSLIRWRTARSHALRCSLQARDVRYHKKARVIYFADLWMCLFILSLGLSAAIWGFIIWAQLNEALGAQAKLVALQVLDALLLGLAIFRTAQGFLSVWTGWRRAAVRGDEEVAVELGVLERRESWRSKGTVSLDSSSNVF